jgi:AP-1 complex subunit gamma-1
LKSLTYDKNV